MDRTPPRAWRAGGKGRSRSSGIYILAASAFLFILYSTSNWPQDQLNDSVKSLSAYVGTSACPNASNPILPVDTPLNPSQQTCTKVNSGHNDFDVEICPVRSECNRFSVRITRTDMNACNAMESRNLLEDGVQSTEARATWLKEMQGPDSFVLRTTGAQRWLAEDSVYEGQCTYRFDVSLSTGGAFWLELWHMYTVSRAVGSYVALANSPKQNYEYYDETYPSRPPMTFDKLLPAPLKMNICPLRCPMAYAARLASAEPEWPPSANPPREEADLPECSVVGMSQGIWLQRHPMDVTEPPAPVLPPRDFSSGQTLMGHYEYQPGCKWSHAGRQFVSHEGCYKVLSSSVLFAGDSHSRYVMQHFIYRLLGNVGYYPDSDSAKGALFVNFHREYTGEVEKGKLEIDFKWDPMVDQLLRWPLDKLVNYTAIVYSVGAWPAKIPWKEEEFLLKLEKVFKHIQAAIDTVPEGGRKPNLVYLVPTPYPPHLTEASRRTPDHRTNLELMRWRESTIPLCEKYGWRIVDQLGIGMPVSLEIMAADGLHLSPGPAHSPIVDEVVGKAGLCVSR